MSSLHWTQNEKLLLNGSNSWFNIRRAIARRWHSLASSKYHAGRSSSSFSKQSSSDKANTHSTGVFVLLCSIWYTTSALSSNTGKAILIQFRYPVTLTIIQFAFVALYSLLLMTPVMRFSHLRRPTRAIINSTLPMGLFQVGGHMFSSMAISRIPVSTVHTIKVRYCRYLNVPLNSNLHIPGTIAPLHRSCLLSPFRSELFCENIHFALTAHPRRHARMLL